MTDRAPRGTCSQPRQRNAIALRRWQRGMGATELARAAGISRTTLWRTETGRTLPTAAVVSAIAAALHCRAQDLVYEPPR